MRQLGGDGHRDDPGPILLHVPASVGQTFPVGEQHFDGEPTGDLDAMLPVAGEDEVVGLQGESRPDLDRLLPFQHGVGADTALSLQRQHPPVERSR